MVSGLKDENENVEGKKGFTAREITEDEEEYDKDGIEIKSYGRWFNKAKEDDDPLKEKWYEKNRPRDYELGDI